MHDFIQWLFPLDEASGANWEAPILTAADIRAFHDDAALRAALKRSFVRMLAFYGLRLREDSEDAEIERTGNWTERARVWLTPHNHNHLRLTRIMKSLTLLGEAALARTLKHVLLVEAEAAGPNAVTRTTLRYWQTAA